MIRLLLELAALVQEDFHHRSLAQGRYNGHVRFAVAVDVAEGGRRGADVPRGDNHVFLRNAEIRVRLLRLDQPPAARLGDLDASPKRVRRTTDGAVSRQYDVRLQVSQFAQTAQHVAGAEVDAAG